MKAWLRRVTPDLFIAAVIALLATLALHMLDGVERGRIINEVRWEAREGLTLDERMGVFERSLERSLLVHLPLLVVMAALMASLLCRNRRWAWLTSMLASIPLLLTGASYLIDVPLRAAFLVSAYLMISAAVAIPTVRLRNHVLPLRPPSSDRQS